MIDPWGTPNLKCLRQEKESHCKKSTENDVQGNSENKIVESPWSSEFAYADTMVDSIKGFAQVK